MPCVILIHLIFTLSSSLQTLERSRPCYHQASSCRCFLFHQSSHTTPRASFCICVVEWSLQKEHQQYNVTLFGVLRILQIPGLILFDLFSEVNISYLLCCVRQTLPRGQSRFSGRGERNAPRCLDQQSVRREYWFSFHPPGGKMMCQCNLPYLSRLVWSSVHSSMIMYIMCRDSRNIPSIFSKYVWYISVLISLSISVLWISKHKILCAGLLKVTWHDCLLEDT